MAEKRKLTKEQIEEIKALKAEIEAAGGKFVYVQIGRAYGVSGQTIRRNIEPNENDKKPRSNNPAVSMEYERNFLRRYFLRLNIKNTEDARVIKKLDSVANKNKYIKGLVLKDISSEQKNKE